MLTYKGYIGSIELDEENELFNGQVVNTKDVITFQSETAHGLKQAFIDSIEDYLEFCASRNESPDRPFSGNFQVRITPELHQKIFIAARLEGKSLNAWVSSMLQHAT